MTKCINLPVSRLTISFIRKMFNFANKGSDGSLNPLFQGWTNFLHEGPHGKKFEAEGQIVEVVQIYSRDAEK